MKAIVIEQFGDPHVLIQKQIEVPTFQTTDLLIQIKACAMNHLDIWVRKGLLKLPFPHILGSDISGVVQQVGNVIKDIKIGDEVVLSPGLSCGHCEACLNGDDNLCREYKVLGEHVWGGYAEFIKVPRQNVMIKSRNLSFEEAAAIPLTFLTAWQMLVRKAHVKPGDWVLVLAAGSGIGVAAIQIAKLFGATVIATASTLAKLKKAEALGADYTIHYIDKDFSEEVKKITKKRGVDIVVEQTGKATWEKSLLSVKWGGTIVTCGATTGADAKTDLAHVFYRQLKILGSTMGSKGDLFEIMRWAEKGQLKPVIDEVLPLADAQKAHQKMESRNHFGKIILCP